MGEGANICTDIPRYRIYENGVFTKEITDASEYWKEGYVGFLIGCSFSFEEALIREGIDVRPEHDLGKVLSRSLRPPDLRHDAGPGLSFQRQDPKIRECLQKCADLSRRLKFFPRKLRMHMEVSLKLQDPVVFLVQKSVLMHFFLHEPPGTVLPVF